jgi:hypothetical protein
MPNPILKVLSTLERRRAAHLLMGGQACVFYGGAEFSRDTDVVVPAEAENLGRLAEALADLQAEPIAIPPLSAEYLQRGHAVHFRCRHPEAEGMRIDVMSVLRGVAPFPELWERRTTLEIESGSRIEMISLPDLVLAKKTQRDKDWPMIRRLVESHFVRHRDSPEPRRVDFWLRECRTPAILFEIAERFAEQTASALSARPLLARAAERDESGLREALAAEEAAEREADRRYWLPLRRELEELRRKRIGGSGGTP